MNAPALYPQLSVITGCMFSGKTEELIRQLKRAKIAGLKPIIFKPTKDVRTGRVIESRSGHSMEAHSISRPEQILFYTEPHHQVIGIDEAQFFDTELIKVVQELIKREKSIVVAGLDLDFEEKPYEVMSHLLALGHPVAKLTAICVTCQRREATRSKRLTEETERELIGSEQYEARCLGCYH